VGILKKIKIVQVTGIILFLLYFVLLIIDLLIGVFANYSFLVFSIIISAIGINLIYKGVLIKSSSTLWFANTLILYSILIAVLDLLNYDFFGNRVLFSIVPIVSSLINLFVFQNLIYVKVIIINLSIIIPMVIEYYADFEFGAILAVFLISIGVGICACRLINFDKENV